MNIRLALQDVTDRCVPDSQGAVFANFSSHPPSRIGVTPQRDRLLMATGLQQEFGHGTATSEYQYWRLTCRCGTGEDLFGGNRSAAVFFTYSE